LDWTLEGSLSFVVEVCFFGIFEFFVGFFVVVCFMWWFFYVADFYVAVSYVVVLVAAVE
jgi:hypothetical protein